jgi:hypothetical protein
MNDEHGVRQDVKEKSWEKVVDLLLTNTWQTIDVDLTKHIPHVGQYEVEIRPVEGIELSRVVVVMAGTEAPRLITKLDRPNAWNINRTAAVTSAPRGHTSLRLVAKSAGNGSRRSWLYVREMQ